jgi:hypothetical protein
MRTLNGTLASAWILRLGAVGSLLLASVFAAGCNDSVVVDGTTPPEELPVDCPAEPPQEGTPCNEAVPGCGYPDGDCGYSYYCSNGTWAYTYECLDGCPGTMPTEGDDCESLTTQCTYETEDVPCGPDGGIVHFQCTEQGWTALGPRCQPEPECPDQLPTAGYDCTGWDYAYFCSYEVLTGCGIKTAVASCYQDGTSLWDVDLESCPSCADMPSIASCAAAPECRWLVPGCDQPPAFEAGCFPAADCAPDSCGAGEACAETSYDPCWDSECNACAAPAQVCLPVEG